MGMQSTKSIFQSLTINASLISMAATILSGFGINLAPDVVPQLNTIVAGVSAAVAIYGRIRAHTIIA